MYNNELKVLTVAEVAKRLKIGRNKVYELFNQRDFPSFKLGKNLRVSEPAFEEWLLNQSK